MGTANTHTHSLTDTDKIKRREVSWTLTKSWTIIYGSIPRDQEEGGGAGPSREPRRDQEREVELDPQESSGEIKRGRWSWAQKVGQPFASVVPQQLSYVHRLCDCSAQQLKQQLEKYGGYFALARSPPP